jgi:hypothetical protein
VERLQLVGQLLERQLVERVELERQLLERQLLERLQLVGQLVERKLLERQLVERLELVGLPVARRQLGTLIRPTEIRGAGARLAGPFFVPGEPARRAKYPPFEIPQECEESAQAPSYGATC